MARRKGTRERVNSDGPAAARAAALEEIFTSIRTGETPWETKDLPPDIDATGLLLSELDRLWQNPPPAASAG